jgi:hypothetical protein
MNDMIQCDVYDRCTGTQNWAYTMYNIVTNFVNIRSERAAVIVHCSDITSQKILYIATFG